MPDRPLILITDDNSSIRAYLDAALQHAGFDTSLAANGREALDRLQREPVAAVLLDLDMPVLDGRATLTAIRADEQLRTLPVILVTGSDEEADRIRGLDSGADDYLVKPVRVNELVARVRAQVRGRSPWASELERGRESRRRLAAALEGMPGDLSLMALAAELVTRLPDALDIDAVAILYFDADLARGVAASGPLLRRFPPGRELAEDVGRELVARAASGAWLEIVTAPGARRSRVLDAAFVPFKLGPALEPLGALVYAVGRGRPSRDLSRRLPDLIDATNFLVAVLRPAVEQAGSADARINRIRQIIVGREFGMVFQPIQRLSSATTVAVEALARFADGLPPDGHFAEAASMGLGPPLERVAVTAALEAATAFPVGIALSMNLSADVLQHEPSLPELFRSTERPLVVELTEHERIDDYGAVRAALARLGPNVQLAIDDAGSGFASLRHIFALQPAYVKLDIEWVHGIERDAVRRALVSGLVYFAQETGCELIAEGIETEAELAAVRELGIDLGQGYLLGRPEPSR